MKVVVGLGNPGVRYRATRHNVGFMVLETMARELDAGKPKQRFEGEVAEARLDGLDVLLVAPQTFMNASGRCVRQVVSYFRVPLDDLLVVCDDLALPLGKLRLRARGSSGGHKGLRDIIAHLGTEEYARLRIGIGSPPPNADAADWVLSRFSPDELAVIRDSQQQGAEAVKTWMSEGIEAAMNRYN